MLTEFKGILDIGIPLEKIINLVEYKYEPILKSEYIFKKEALLYYLNKGNSHNRYSYSIFLFNKTLHGYLNETIDNITDLIEIKENTNRSTGTHNDANLFEINIVDGDDIPIITDKKVHFDYEFSKLFDRHPIFDISYFRTLLQENVLIDELNNMEENFQNDLEYYCSYEYLRKLLQDRGLLTPYDY